LTSCQGSGKGWDRKKNIGPGRSGGNSRKKLERGEARGGKAKRNLGGDRATRFVPKKRGSKKEKEERKGGAASKTKFIPTRPRKNLERKG